MARSTLLIVGRLFSAVRREQGLTLVELLVVLVIMGVLLAVAVPTYLGMRERAYDATAKNDLAQARVAAHAYFADTESYAALTFAAMTAFDASLSPRVTVVTAAPKTYCLETTVGGRTWALHGPAADFSRGSC